LRPERAGPVGLALFLFKLTARGVKIVSKEQRSNKETKKKPAMTPKEKKAAKKAKKNERGRIGE
jgi:hypothetical protein